MIEKDNDYLTLLEMDNKEKILNVLATAEFLFKVLGNNSLGYPPDYSGVIILYCKAFEKLQLIKYDSIKKEIPKLIKEFVKIKEMEKRKKKLIFTDESKNKIIEYMQNNTKVGNRNAFYENTVCNKLTKLKNDIDNGNYNDNWFWNMHMYNTLIFLYWLEKGMDENKCHLIKEIYILYEKHRNESCHAGDIKSKEDAKEVRETVLGKDNLKNSNFYYMYHYM